MKDYNFALLLSAGEHPQAMQKSGSFKTHHESLIIIIAMCISLTSTLITLNLQRRIALLYWWKRDLCAWMKCYCININLFFIFPHTTYEKQLLLCYFKLAWRGWHWSESVCAVVVAVEEKENEIWIMTKTRSTWIKWDCFLTFIFILFSISFHKRMRE